MSMNDRGFWFLTRLPIFLKITVVLPLAHLFTYSMWQLDDQPNEGSD